MVDEEGIVWLKNVTKTVAGTPINDTQGDGVQQVEERCVHLRQCENKCLLDGICGRFACSWQPSVGEAILGAIQGETGAEACQSTYY
eukprot:6150342-Amphidinium_carterae.1